MTKYIFLFIAIICLSFNLHANEIDNIDKDKDTEQKNTKQKTEDISYMSGGKFVILDKMSTKRIFMDLINGEEKKNHNIVIKLISCIIDNKPLKPRHMALIEIKDINNNKILFFNWLVSDHHSATVFNHPIYNIVITECIND